MQTLRFSPRSSFQRFPGVASLMMLGIAPLAIYIQSFLGGNVSMPYALAMWALYAFVFIAAFFHLLEGLTRFEIELCENELRYMTRFRSRRIAYSDIQNVSGHVLGANAVLVVRHGGGGGAPFGIPVHRLREGSKFVHALKERLDRHAPSGTYARLDLFDVLKEARKLEDSAARVPAHALGVLTVLTTVVIPIIS